MRRIPNISQPSLRVRRICDTVPRRRATNRGRAEISVAYNLIMFTHRKADRSLRWRQGVVVSLLFGGYGALYFCRADFSVGTPLLIDALNQQGISHGDAIIRMGSIASFGVLAYALGKLFLGDSAISGAAG